MRELLWVALGGAVGAPLRALLTAWAAGSSFGRPLGTLAVNLLGSLALGYVAAVLARTPEGGAVLRPLVALGLLGSFTTFSTFAVEVLEMAQGRSLLAAAGYALGTLAACLCAAALGALACGLRAG
jgi:CrcB protein